MQERNGIIIDLEREILRDIESGNERNFINPARITVQVNDEVIYVEILVRPPTGGEQIINVVKAIQRR